MKNILIQVSEGFLLDALRKQLKLLNIKRISLVQHYTVSTGGETIDIFTASKNIEKLELKIKKLGKDETQVLLEEIGD